VLCAPGFSTRDEADMTSGRGVGMDVVRSTVRALAGELSLDSTPGRGTRFVVELPLTLMILDALLVDVGGQQMAVPQPALREILQVAGGGDRAVREQRRDRLPRRRAPAGESWRACSASPSPARRPSTCSSSARRRRRWGSSSTACSACARSSCTPSPTRS
jgi:chemotaxis protein histidine kinase CheA